MVRLSPEQVHAFSLKLVLFSFRRHYHARGLVPAQQTKIASIECKTWCACACEETGASCVSLWDTNKIKTKSRRNSDLWVPWYRKRVTLTKNTLTQGGIGGKSGT